MQQTTLLAKSSYSDKFFKIHTTQKCVQARLIMLNIAPFYLPKRTDSSRQQNLCRKRVNYKKT